MSNWAPGLHNSWFDPTGQGQNYPTTRPRTFICVKAQELGHQALKLLQLIGCVIKYDGCSTVARRLHVRDSDQRQDSVRSSSAAINYCNVYITSHT